MKIVERFPLKYALSRCFFTAVTQGIPSADEKVLMDDQSAGKWLPFRQADAEEVHPISKLGNISL